MMRALRSLRLNGFETIDSRTQRIKFGAYRDPVSPGEQRNYSDDSEDSRQEQRATGYSADGVFGGRNVALDSCYISFDVFGSLV